MKTATIPTSTHIFGDAPTAHEHNPESFSLSARAVGITSPSSLAALSCALRQQDYTALRHYPTSPFRYASMTDILESVQCLSKAHPQ